MKRICKIIGLGLMALSLMPGAVLGQTTLRHSTPVRVMRGSPGIFSPWILRGLDLTAEQQAQLQEIRAAHQATLRDLFNQIRTVRGEIADKLSAAGEATAEDFTDQTERLAKLQQQLLREGLTVALKVRAVLTPDQRAKAEQIRQRLKQLHEEMRSLYGAKR